MRFISRLIVECERVGRKNTLFASAWATWMCFKRTSGTRPDWSHTIRIRVSGVRKNRRRRCKGPVEVRCCAHSADKECRRSAVVRWPLGLDADEWRARLRCRRSGQWSLPLNRLSGCTTVRTAAVRARPTVGVLISPYDCTNLQMDIGTLLGSWVGGYVVG